mmetsp:Transcript_64330/g.102407  ORF Transcript_64330/g.102407 Transcript_64330/m.102407 type:complete len:109 (-) Transcript_64330:20-346(-)
MTSGGCPPPALASISLQVQNVSTNTTSTMKLEMLAPLFARRASAFGSAVFSIAGVSTTGALMKLLPTPPFCFAFSVLGESPERIEKDGDDIDRPFFPTADNPLRTLMG